LRHVAQLITERNTEMALIATVSFSKKVPVPDSEYSSQGYSLSLQTEISESDPEAIQARLSRTFQLVKDQVEHELANSGHVAQPAEPGGKPNGGNDKASNKQIKFITDLSTQRGISLSDLNADVQKRYGVAGLYDLSRKQASELLDAMNGKRKAA
jgi:hypothetical protein